jgi:hypothetical protein
VETVVQCGGERRGQRTGASLSLFVSEQGQSLADSADGGRVGTQEWWPVEALPQPGLAQAGAAGVAGCCKRLAPPAAVPVAALWPL